MYGLPKDFDGARLVGCFLVQVCFGVGQIQFRFDKNVMIAVENTIVYQNSPSSELKTIGIPGPPAAQADLLRLLHHTIVNASGDRNGTLTMEFDNGSTLQLLDDDPAYEAYQIRIGDNWIIV